MPNASEIESIKKLRIMLYSLAGAGKTTLFRSLPGKKFVFVFDPAGLVAYQKTDNVEYETFIPTSQNLAISTNKGITRSEVNYSGSEVYNQYESFIINKHEEENYFSQFDWICIDSITSLQSIMLDYIANLYGREGRNPQLEDHGIMAESLLKNIRMWTSLPCNVIILAHEKAAQDKLMRTVGMDIMVPGNYSKKIVLLLSDIYHLRVTRDSNNKPQYLMDIAPTDDYQLARCSLGLEPTIDVTIPSNVVRKTSSDITKYGLGKIIREEGYYEEN